MKTPHKHAELIKAWADGAEIQFRFPCDLKWTDTKTPSWDGIAEYRIKPEPKPDLIRFTSVMHIDTNIATNTKYASDNLKLTFDGETGRLKAAEVLK
jgi:hypothetical protein